MPLDPLPPNRKAALFLSIFLAVCLSCNDRSTNWAEESDIKLDNFKSYKLDLKGKKEKLSNLIESIELVRLEETEESLLANVRSISRHKNQFVFNSEGGDDVYSFDSQGNFLYKFNRSGNGPEQYRQIKDLWLEGDTVVIYNWAGQAIKKYSLNGDFINSTKLPQRVGHVYSYKNGYALGTNFTPLNDSVRYKWVLWDKDLKIRKGFLPFEPAHDNQRDVLYSLNSITPYNESRLLLRMHSDTVYLLKDDELSPLVRFDFGEQWFWKGRDIVTDRDFVEIEETDKAWDNAMNMGQSQIYLKSVIGYKGWEHFLINRHSGQIQRLDLRKTASEQYELRTLLWEEDRLLCSIPSTDIAELLSELETDQITFREGSSLDEIESSENPALIWIKFK